MVQTGVCSRAVPDPTLRPMQTPSRRRVLAAVCTVLVASIGIPALTAKIAGAQPAASAPVSVDRPWVRAVPGQAASGAFMTIRAAQAVRLVGAETPAAGVAEIHEMSMDNGVMRMKAVPDGIAIVAGTPLDLKPGGYHVMLMDLKTPIKAGDAVPLKLRFVDAAGKPFDLTVQATASMQAPAAHQH
ncbi:copper chaperone PCu(A)C [soil metagenome]